MIRFLLAKDNYRKKIELITENVSKLVFIQANKNKCLFYFSDGKLELINLVLKQTLKLLPNTFIRIHRSYVVNITFIERYSDDKTRLYLKNRKVLPVKQI